MSLHTPSMAKHIKYAVLLAGVIAIAAPAAACPIPVYQYSLEWWERDPYEIYVFDNEDLTEEQNELVERLKHISEGKDENTPANVRLRLVQSESEDRLRAHSALRGKEPETFPWMVVYYPSMSSHSREPIWMGELSDENLDALLHSPKRQEMSELLLDRASVVWLLLESGNSSSDNEAAALVEEEVQRLEETLVPSDPTGFDLDDIPIHDIKFETMRLSRDDADERMFIEMLTNSEVDLGDYEDEPMLFPIFGRGLIMYALVGKGINTHMIRDAAEFLTGPCSCTVKSLNPGVDIITSVDWAGNVEQFSEDYATEAPSSVGGFMDSVDEAEQEEPDSN
ncbi:MAG: hypothetical protein ACLFU6_09610 [Candidatus Hydrogenedentota bacterium]